MPTFSQGRLPIQSQQINWFWTSRSANAAADHLAALADRGKCPANWLLHPLSFPTEICCMMSALALPKICLRVQPYAVCFSVPCVKNALLSIKNKKNSRWLLEFLDLQILIRNFPIISRIQVFQSKKQNEILCWMEKKPEHVLKSSMIVSSGHK